MKLLLTSNGLSNDSIAKAFQEMIGVEPPLSKIAFIPTAANPDRGNKDWLIDDLYRIKSRGYGVDIINLEVLKPAEIKAALEASHAIFVGGGNSFYLSYWMQKSGVFDILPKLLETRLYAGISAGSMIVANSLHVASQALSRFGELRDDEYDELGPKGFSSSKTAKLVDFEFRPHLNSPHFPLIRNERFIKKVAKTLDVPMYAIDDESALKVVDGKVDVISEGKWLKLEPRAGNT